MEGHNIRKTARSPWMTAALAASMLASLGAAQMSFAKPGGEPLVLDTETGIHSGVPGTVLQTAPLNSSGMVQMDTLPNLPQQDQQPIVVSPYVEYSNSSGQSSAPATGGGRHRTPRAPSY